MLLADTQPLSPAPLAPLPGLLSRIRRPRRRGRRSWKSRSPGSSRQAARLACSGRRPAAAISFGTIAIADDVAIAPPLLFLSDERHGTVPLFVQEVDRVIEAV